MNINRKATFPTCCLVVTAEDMNIDRHPLLRACSSADNGPTLLWRERDKPTRPKPARLRRTWRKLANLKLCCSLTLRISAIDIQDRMRGLIQLARHRQMRMRRNTLSTTKISYVCSIRFQTPEKLAQWVIWLIYPDEPFIDWRQVDSNEDTIFPKLGIASTPALFRHSS